jgi:hypothetical protein
MATYKMTGRIHFENNEMRTVTGDTFTCEYGTTQEVIGQYLVRWASIMGCIATYYTLEMELVTLD